MTRNGRFVQDRWGRRQWERGLLQKHLVHWRGARTQPLKRLIDLLLALRFKL